MGERITCRKPICAVNVIIGIVWHGVGRWMDGRMERNGKNGEKEIEDDEEKEKDEYNICFNHIYIFFIPRSSLLSVNSLLVRTVSHALILHRVIQRVLVPRYCHTLRPC